MTIVIDCETTGLNPGYDEILQLAIIDQHGNTLFNERIRPSSRKEWREAERINGISPEDVKDCKTFLHHKDTVQRIVDGASIVVGYNFQQFDKWFLIDKGIDFSTKASYDVMLEFAEIYGEWNDYFQDYKWQKLTTCALYYSYGSFGAHDALEDCKATLHCYKCMIEENKKSQPC